MHEAFIADWFNTVWAGVSGMAAAFPGGLDYARKSAGASGNYARFTVTSDKVIHISDRNKSATYRVLLESFLRNASTAELKAASSLLDTALVTALEAAAGATIGGGSGEPTGTVNYAWRVSAPAGDGTLITDEERKAGADVQCLKWMALVRVQWA